MCREENSDRNSSRSCVAPNARARSNRLCRDAAVNAFEGEEDNAEHRREALARLKQRGIV
jgi:hypothetical protein